MSTRAKPQKSTHTHTHTHTHTDSLITSLKQIGTICLTISLFTIPNFASAENIPTTNPGCTTTVLGAQNIANGSASLEPDFSANTINTTWYSNGEQLTGNNIPGTCRYDAALTPPTPAARPGYTFNGWTLRVPAAPVVPTLEQVLAMNRISVVYEPRDEWDLPPVDIPDSNAYYSSGVYYSDYNLIATYADGSTINGFVACGDGDMGYAQCGCYYNTFTPNGGTEQAIAVRGHRINERSSCEACAESCVSESSNYP